MGERVVCQAADGGGCPSEGCVASADEGWRVLTRYRDQEGESGRRLAKRAGGYYFGKWGHIVCT